MEKANAMSVEKEANYPESMQSGRSQHGTRAEGLEAEFAVAAASLAPVTPMEPLAEKKESSLRLTGWRFILVELS